MSTSRAIAVTSLVALLASPSARASTSFPIDIAEHISAEVVPTCLICHQTLLGGLGTVTKPFGIAMRSAGTEAGEVEDMLNALDVLDAAHSDVDADGTPDVDELRAGTDPNDEKDGFQPRYGFSCAQGPGAADAAWLTAVLALTALCVRPRRRMALAGDATMQGRPRVQR